MTRHEYTVGVDIGATKIASVLVDKNGNILANDYRMTDPTAGEDGTFERIVTGIMNVTGGHYEISGIGIDVPGVVDPVLGTVENAVNLGWEKVTLREEIQKRIPKPIPIYMERDTYAQTLGEYYFGTARNVTDYVYLGIGSGLGAGALVNGSLLQGSKRAALEIGHLGLTGLTLTCGCGRIGCAETLLSGPGMVKTYLSNTWQPDLPLNDSTSTGLSAQEILARAQSGDARAMLLVDEFGRYLGELISDLLMILNPSLVVIGGGLGASAFDQISSSMHAEIVRRSMPDNYRNLRIEKSTLRSSALGAASLVWYSQNQL
jgi:glucokinase